MQRANTPPLSNGTKHYDTSTRAKVLHANDFVDSLSPTTRRRTNFTKKKLYKALQIPQRTARYTVKTRESRQSNHIENKPETRGAKKILTPEDVHYAEQELV